MIEKVRRFLLVPVLVVILCLLLYLSINTLVVPTHGAYPGLAISQALHKLVVENTEVEYDVLSFPIVLQKGMVIDTRALARANYMDVGCVVVKTEGIKDLSCESWSYVCEYTGLMRQKATVKITCLKNNDKNMPLDLPPNLKECDFICTILITR